MDSPVATIISLSNGMATVLVDRASVCARCAAGKGCGAGVFSSSKKPAKLEVPVPVTLRLRVGDRVNLTLQPERLLRASFLVYGLPLVGIVAMLSLGFLLMGPLNEAAAISLAVAGLLAGLMGGRYSLARNHCMEQFVPSISALAESQP
jgi:sigma-E factor negative regulatory protein RseC